MSCRSFLIVAAFVVSATTAHAQTTPLYRVFLSDGSALASFGEWARVEDRLVFSMPLAAEAGPGDLHLVSLPVQRVDLARTERYAEAVRAAHYASTRGEADFAQLSGAIAQTLNQIALIPDPKQRLATAEQARRALAEWPRAHYGYRATEVREIIGVLDEVISGLRASAGQGAFEFALLATTAPPLSEPILGAPSHADVVRNLIAAAAVVDSPIEKVSLLHSVVRLLDRAVDYLPESIASAFRSRALTEISEEERINTAYGDLRSRALEEATRLAGRADVRAIEQLRRRVREHDTQLGSRRPDEVAGLIATLDAHLDAAHRLRLAQDQWLLTETRMRAYQRSALPLVQALLDSQADLDDIKLLAGPAPHRLRPLARDLDRHARQLALLDAPSQLGSIHAVFRSAYALAESAVQLRRDAIEAADVELARQASAAAAGAVMLLERGRRDLGAALQPPLSLGSSRRP